MPGTTSSPLAEGRELKFIYAAIMSAVAMSPLAEGRELKYLFHRLLCYYFIRSPLAEGRELKYFLGRDAEHLEKRRPSRRGVN